MATVKPAYISLGAGTQSSALVLLAVEGKIPNVARVIFADTGEEPAAVYDWLTFLTEFVGDRLEIETVEPARPLGDVGLNYLPTFTLNSDGTKGLTTRQCTAEFKVKPVRRAIRQDLDRRGIKVGGGKHAADLLLGISLDEAHRMKASRVKYLRHLYPLVDLGWRRQDTIDYVESVTGRTPPRSACVFCPYRSAASWVEIRDGDPDGWERSIEVDRRLRDPKWQVRHKADGTTVPLSVAGDPGRTHFLHVSRKPLSEAVIVPEDAGQLSLLSDEDGFGNECEGGCGL